MSYGEKLFSMQQQMRHKGKKLTWNENAEAAYQRMKKELRGMPTENDMYIIKTNASVIAISGIFHQEKTWNVRTVLRPTAYGSKDLSDTKMK